MSDSRSIVWLGAVFALTFSAWAPVAASEPGSADRWLIVDCLLPGAIRKLGARTTYMSARRPLRTSADECEIRGGEYTAYDRADFATSLSVWLAAAKQGDSQAQVNVGLIFERGMGTPPDFAEAARWYQLAAAGNNVQAKVNLAHLYERGLGVPANPAQAKALYQQASGLVDVELDGVGRAEEEQALAVDALRQELLRLQHENRQLEQVLIRASQQEQRVTQMSADRQIDADERARLTEEIERLEASRSAQAERTQRLEEALAATQSAAGRVQRELEARHAQVDESLATAADLAVELEEVETLLAHSASMLQAREVRTAELEHDLGKLQAQIADLERTRQDAERAVSDGLLTGPRVTMVEPLMPDRRNMVPLAVRAGGSAGAVARLVGRVEAPAGLLTLLVNGEPVIPGADGLFQSAVSVASVPKSVSVIAVDRQGKHATLEFAFAATDDAIADTVADAGRGAGAAAFAAAGIEFGHYHALVIGNNDYAHLPRLKTAVTDATTVEQLLREKYGYQTELLLNATRYELLSALNRYREKLSSGDNLLLYYAGHGELDRVNMRGHWLPIDAETDNTANWISNVAITDILHVMAAKQVLLIVDSCYAGALTRSSVSALTTGTTEAERLVWLGKMTEKRARLVLTSGGLAPVLDEGGGEHSVFANSLIDVLRNSRELLDGRRLHQEVTARVAYAATRMQFDQVPEYSPIRFAGHEMGEFFFVPRN